MKVIDLLNKIANGEEVPKKIKSYQGQIYLYEDSGEYVCFETQDLLFDFPAFRQLGDYLNDEVEIIEEDNKIEKLKQRTDTGLFGSMVNDEISVAEAINKQANYLSEIVSKTNEIIDYLEEKR